MIDLDPIVFVLGVIVGLVGGLFAGIWLGHEFAVEFLEVTRHEDKPKDPGAEQ